MSDTPAAHHPDATRHFAAIRPKVAPFARYKGTSAWRKDRRRVRAYALFMAAARRTEQDGATAKG